MYFGRPWKTHLVSLNITEDTNIFNYFPIGRKVHWELAHWHSGLPDGIFSNQNPDLGKFWRRLINSMPIWNILGPFGTIYGHNLQAIWYIFPYFWYIVSRKIWQPCWHYQYLEHPSWKSENTLLVQKFAFAQCRDFVSRTKPKLNSVLGISRTRLDLGIGSGVLVIRGWYED
jgi:hypothetical protein